MGCERFYPEEAPVREVDVDGFWIDRHPVTVREFHAFVRETGHRTLAERAPTQEEYPDADPDLLVAGLAGLQAPAGPGAPGRPPPLVGLRARRRLAPPRGPCRSPVRARSATR